MKNVVALCLFAFLPSFAVSQCVNGICTPSLHLAERDGYAKHGWFPDGTLYWRGEKIGTLDLAAGQWQTAGKTTPVDLAAHFGLQRPSFTPTRTFAQIGVSKRTDACACFNACECQPVCDCRDNAFISADGPINNFGMEWRGEPGKERCTVNGREVTKDNLIHAIGGAASDIHDDSKLMRLIVTGSDAGRKRVVDDWSAKLSAKWSNKVLMQSYPADHWLLKSNDGSQSYYPATKGDPTIYLVEADGKYRSVSDYSRGPDGLDMALAKAEKLRDPNAADPKRVPDLTSPDVPVDPKTPVVPATPGTPIDWGKLVPVLLALGLGLGSLIYVRVKQK